MNVHLPSQGSVSVNPTTYRDQDLIIKTKLQQPPLRPDVLARQRLIEKLNRSLSSRLTLISAPAGFGKTTLALSWLKQLNVPVSWVSLDTQDNNSARFFTYLVASVFRDNVGLRDAFINEMDSRIFNTIDNRNVAERILQELSNLTPFRIVVLDDYHCITDPKIHEAMSFIIQNLPLISAADPVPPTGCHIVLISRWDPPFPIPRWRVREEITEVRAADLRFSAAETELICNQVLKLNLNHEDLVALEERTEGWVAGLQMAALSLNGLQAGEYGWYIRQIKGNNSIIADYLVEEVFSQLDAETQSFLLQTCILERMSAPLCDSVTQTSGSQRKLETLEKKNVLVIPLDNERCWYRYHQLFSDVLLNRLKDDPRYSIQALHSRAAEWFEQNGIIEDSLKHWMAAGQYDQAARLVVDSAPGSMCRGQYYILSNIIEAFPEESFKTWPWLSIYLAWAYIFIESESVETWLLMAEQVLEKDFTHSCYTPLEIEEMYGDIATIRAFLAAREGDFATVTHNAPKALELLPPGKKKVRGLVLQAIATGQYVAWDLDKAIQTYTESNELLLQDRNLAGYVYGLDKTSEILEIQGKLHEAAKVHQQTIALDHFYPSRELFIGCCGYARLGRIYYEWNQKDAAIQNLTLGYERGKRMGLSERVYCAVALANLWIHFGELEKAEGLLTGYLNLIGSNSIVLWYEKFLASRWMSLLAMQGKSREFHRFMRERDIDQSIHLNDPIHEPENLAYAKALYFLGDYDKSLGLANELENNMALGGRTGRQIQTLAIRGACWMAKREVKRALPLIAKALRLSRREGYIRTYVELGEPMLEGLSRLSNPNLVGIPEVDQGYLAEIMNAWLSVEVDWTPGKPAGKATPGENDLRSETGCDPLTETEKKVLKRLCAGQDNNEMADKMGVSPNTIKKHIANIYRKLGVHNRFQAAVRVKQFDIL